MLVMDKNYMQMTMGFEENAVMCALLLRCRKKRRRKSWVHPLINRRLLKGRCNKLLIIIYLKYIQKIIIGRDFRIQKLSTDHKSKCVIYHTCHFKI